MQERRLLTITVALPLKNNCSTVHGGSSSREREFLIVESASLQSFQRQFLMTPPDAHCPRRARPL